MSTRSRRRPRPWAAKPGRKWRLTRAWRLGRPRPAGSCAVCHGRVLPDDALGLVGHSVTHAECALVSWLGPGRLERELS